MRRPRLSGKGWNSGVINPWISSFHPSPTKFLPLHPRSATSRGLGKGENGISGRKMGFLEFWGHKSMDPSQILVSTRSPDGTLEFWGGINNLG